MRLNYSTLSLSLGLFTLLSSSFITVANAVTLEQASPQNLQSLTSQDSSKEPSLLTNKLSSWSKTTWVMP